MSVASVIIPTNNHAAYLPDAVNSMLAHTHHNVNIFVSDSRYFEETARVPAGYLVARTAIVAPRIAKLNEVIVDGRALCAPRNPRDSAGQMRDRLLR